MEWVLVNTSQISTKPSTAHRISERSGRPGRPPPPPPKRSRLRRTSSSRAETFAPARVRRPRLGGSLHGPPPSPDGGSSPPSLLLGPHGPLVSANRPRTRPPHPEMLLIGAEYRGTADEKQWQGGQLFLCARHGPPRGPAHRPAARRPDPLAQARQRCRDGHR